MQRRRIPGPVRAAVHRPGLASVREERARIGHVGARLGGGYEVAISAQIVNVVTAGAGQLIISTDHRRTFRASGAAADAAALLPVKLSLSASSISALPPLKNFLAPELLLRFSPVHVLKVYLR